RFRNFGRSGSGLGSFESLRTSAAFLSGITDQNQSHLASASTRRVSISPDSRPAHGDSFLTCRILLKFFLTEHFAHSDRVYNVLHGSALDFRGRETNAPGKHQIRRFHL